MGGAWWFGMAEQLLRVLDSTDVLEADDDGAARAGPGGELKRHALGAGRVGGRN